TLVPAGIVPRGAMAFTGPCPAPVTDAIARGATFLSQSLVVDQQLYRRLGWPEPKHWNEMASVLAANNYNRSIDHSAEAVLGCTQAATDRRILRSLWARKGRALTADEMKVATELSVRRVHLIAAMAAVIGPNLSIDEDVRQLDAQMNSDGVRADLELLTACISMRGKLSQVLKDHADQIKGGLPGKPPTYRDALKALGFQVLNEKVRTLTQALEKAVDADNFHAQVLLVALLSAQQTTASKFEKILKTICSDGFLRGLYVYQQARTGRWTSEDVQMHNMKRTILDCDEIKNLIVAVKSGSVEAVLECVPLEKAHEAISGLIRAVFIPRDGYRFLVADFKAIEPRVLLWLVGDMKLLGIFISCDFYVAFAELIFGKTSPSHREYEFRRAIGKLAVLGCLYGMGVDQFIKHCLKFGIDLVGTGIDAKKIVDLFRQVFATVRRHWYGYQDAAFAVIKTKKPVPHGRVVFSLVGNDLHLMLPSGRFMIYHNARIEEGLYGDVLGYTHHKAKGRPEEVQAWGGKITENICQAVARDVLAEGMVRVHKAGFKISLHTHDEVVAEALIDQLSTAKPEIRRLLEQSPAWAPDLPLQLEMFESDRYGEESII
ncbi:MAG: DNA polymerase, partial [Acidobacteriota bacterium]